MASATPPTDVPVGEDGLGSGDLPVHPAATAADAGETAVDSPTVSAAGSTKSGTVPSSSASPGFNAPSPAAVPLHDVTITSPSSSSLGVQGEGPDDPAATGTPALPEGTSSVPLRRSPSASTSGEALHSPSSRSNLLPSRTASSSSVDPAGPSASAHSSYPPNYASADQIPLRRMAPDAPIGREVGSTFLSANTAPTRRRFAFGRKLDLFSRSSRAASKKDSRRRCGIPFFALMFFYMAICTVAVGIIGWQFTTSSAGATITDLASKIQARAASEIKSTIETDSKVITSVTWYQRNMITAVNIVIVLNPIGTLYAYNMDENLNNDLLYLDPGNNSTLQLMQDWVFGEVDLYNYSYHKVGSMYVQDDAAHKTSLAVAYNNVTGESLAVANDWTMLFVQTKLAAVLQRIPYPMFVASIESESGKMIGTSEGSNYITEDNKDILTFNDVANITFLSDFTAYVNRLYPNLTPAQQAMSLAASIQSNGTLTYFSTIDGQEWGVRIDLINFEWDSPWLSVQYLSTTPILADIRATASRVQAIVLSVVAVAVAAGTAVSFVLARQIRLVSQQLAALRDMRFREVMDRERGGVRSRSFVLELYDLQVSFFEMVARFAEQVRASRTLVRGSLTNASMGGAG
ncbi:hypothetical protein HK405_009529 [Cladochytrium tenue]|nr:hypothetical protein HK405_009529 [Cladochytrium tenue]